MRKSEKNNKLLIELKKAAKEKDKHFRGIKIASIISLALKTVGLDPILVGGAAVAYYTDGSYTTADIDMVTPTTPELKKVMNDLGFKKIGKDFINKDLGVYIEFPSDMLGPTERATEIKVDNKKLRIISVEDLIVDRLCAYKYWKSGIDGINSLIILELGIADKQIVENRAREEDVLDALDYLETILEKSIRLKLTPQESSRLVMKYLGK